MSFIFELNEPRLLFAVNLNLNINRAGIDFLALVQIVNIALLFECLCADARHIHKADNLILSVAVKVASKLKIFLKRLFDSLGVSALFNLDFVKLGSKGCVTAVV